MADIGKAYVQIIPKAEGISGQIESMLSDGAEEGGKSAGLSFGKKMIGALGKAGVVAAVGKLFKDSIAEGANLQQSFGGLDTLYGDAAEQAKAYAYEAAKAGISANDYAEQAVSFGASLKQAFGGDTTKAVEAANTAIMDMTDNAAKMGTPIESIQNAYQGFAKQNYTMLDNLKLGYGGTKTEMERLLADASKLSGVEYNIDNLGDVYEAIHVIQEDLGLTGVAAQEASETFSGSFGAMKAAAANVLGNLALGENVLPSLQQLGSSIKTFLVGNAVPMIGNVVEQIPTVLANLPTFIADLLPDLLPAMADIVGKLAQGITDNIPTFVAGVGTMFGKIWDFVETIDWTQVATTIVNLIKAGWDALGDIAQGIWDTVVGIFTGEVEFPDIGAAAQIVWDGLTGIAEGVWDGVVGFFTQDISWPDIAAAAEAVWVGLVSTAYSIWEAFKGWFTKTFNFPDLSELAHEAWSSLVTKASEIWTNIKTALTSVFSFTSLDEKASAAWDTLVTLASSIWESIKSAFTQVFDFTSLDEVATKAWASLVTLAGSFWTSIKGVFGKTDVVFSDLSSLASTAWDALTTTASGIWDGIKEIFGSFDITWPDFGELASGALEGLKNAAKSVWDWVKGLFSGDEGDDAVKSVQGSTSEMAAAFADAKLQVSEVDMSSIIGANEFIKGSIASWKRMMENIGWKLPAIGTTALTTAYKMVHIFVNSSKSAMNFSWSLPTLHGHLPVISVNMRTASSSDGKTSVSYPDLFVSGFKWFGNGGIFDAPQIIGVGERGPEAVVPLDQFWKRMGAEIEDRNNGSAVVNNYFTVDGAQDPEAWAMGAARAIKRELRMA